VRCRHDPEDARQERGGAAELRFATIPGMARVLSTVEGTHEAHAFGPTDWVLFAVPPLIWGCSFLLIAVGIDHFAPSVVTAARIGFGALALGFVPASRKRVPAQEWPRILFVSATWMAIPFSCFSIAEQWISSSLAGMLNGAMPLFAALVATAMLRRAPSRLQIAGLVVGFGGVVLVMWPALDDGGSSSISGVLLVLVAVFCYGLATNVSVPLQQKYGSLAVTFRSQLGALVMTVPFALFGLGGSSFSWTSLAAVAALGAFGTGLAFVALGALLGRVGAARASVAVYFVPVVAVLAGVIFRDEHVAALSLAGMVLVVAGAAITGRAGARRSTPVAR
jgi:drug/metabolite transporter (DMT)-like permease